MKHRLLLPFTLVLVAIVLGASLTLPYTARAGIITVTNANDAGAGSLRATIAGANSGDTIAFNIPGGGVHTIVPLSPLPPLPNGVTIDGYTQPGSNAATNVASAIVLIELDGQNAGTSVNGLELSGNNTVRGLAINRFDGSGIFVNSSNGNLIEGNIIGLNAAGTTALGNGTGNGIGFGIYVNSGSNNIIGGTTAAARNIISGNGSGNGWNGGILLTSASSGNVIQGNYIGTDKTGTVALGNVNQGINIDHSSGNTIGGTTPGARNLISGNVGQGINIFENDTTTSTSNNIIQGNYIGTNATGTVALGNTTDGVNIWDANDNIIGGTAAGAGNLISGNGGKGILLGGGLTGTQIQGNIIGLNATGTAALGNGAGSSGGFGIYISGGSNNTIGGTAVAARNIISGNGSSNGWSGGVTLSGGSNNNFVQGNYIGTDINGTVALGNVNQGINIDHSSGNMIGGTTAGARNLISGNAGMGINIYESDPLIPTTTNNIIQGNYIGTDVTGTAALGNSDNGIGIWAANNTTIGGTAAGAGNVISGNGGKGIYTGGGLTGTQIQGNFIGTNKTGTAAINNAHTGVMIDGGSNNTIGGTTAAARNIISGNVPIPGDELGGGVQLNGSGTTNNTVQGNYIGTDITGNVALGNGAQGIFINNAPNNQIGGTAAGAGNVISANNGGIMVFDNGTGTTIQGNMIGTNAAGTAALGNFIMGLWLSDEGVTVGGTTPGARNVISANGTTGSNFGFGVYINATATNNIVQGNFIGTDITGTQAIGNEIAGVAIMRSSNNQIGGNSPAARNIISGNLQFGVAIAGNGLPFDLVTPSDDNIVQGNYIGTDVTGTVALPNLLDGINVTNSFNNGVHNNIIGGSGPGEGNLISGNGETGIRIDSGAVGTQVLGNLIGTDKTGTVALGNHEGISIDHASGNTIGGTTAGARNIISGNTDTGVNILESTATNNTVQGNYIGTDITGNVALGNGYQGIFINNAPNNLIGGTAAGAGNVISANNGGIMIFDASDGTKIQGNLIGTNAAGTAALGNTLMGFWIAHVQHVLIGGTTPGARNVISGNGAGPAHFGFGIYFNENSKNNTVQGNFIGTDITGTQAIGNDPGGIALMRSSNNVIGGNTPAARNIISGNIQVGIGIAGNSLPTDALTPSDNNIIQGNYIGTDVTGTAALPNLHGGIEVSNRDSNGVHNNIIGGSGSGEGNLISGNGDAGVMIDNGAVGTQVLGNSIGLDSTGAATLGNNPNGVFIIGATNNTIGGTTASARNVIAGNGRGVVVIQTAAAGNQILGNSIFSNTTLGIDLGEDGITANDPNDTDTGPNNLQNTPVLSSAEATSTTIKISGTLDTQASKAYRVEFFANPVCHASGSGEGTTYLGFANVTTNASGDASFATSLAVTVPLGYFVTVTATDPTHNTSEFSACVLVVSTPLAAPAINIYATADVVVTWSSVVWATGYVVEWDVNNAFSSPTSLATLEPTEQFALITVPGTGVYYWRVRALNEAGTMTTWSNTQTFTVVLP